MTLDNPDKKKSKVDKGPDVSGAYRAEEDEQNKPKRPAFEIAEEAAKKGRFKKSLHQPYNSKDGDCSVCSNGISFPVHDAGAAEDFCSPCLAC